MGCTSSSPNGDTPAEFTIFKAPDPYASDASPSVIRAEITKKYNILKDLTSSLMPSVEERHGITLVTIEEKQRLSRLLNDKEILLKKRKPLLDQTYERDALELNKAFNTTGSMLPDKSVLINILATRTKSQIHQISEVLKKKYKLDLLEKIVSDMQTNWSKLTSGNMTGLTKLLLYRIMSQPERDAALLRDASDGITLDFDILNEIIFTRYNHELKAAIEAYSSAYKKDFVKIVQSKSTYKNYRDFMTKVLECNRDESNRPFDDATAAAYAEELLAAGKGRNYGIDAEPFIRILSTINKAQFDSINEYYEENKLMDDITAKLGGAFELSVRTICTDKYEYLAARLELAFKSLSPDKESICRILGCIARWECVKVADAYDRLNYGRTLEQAIRTIITQKNYQSALLFLVEGDLSLSPVGSDKEDIEYDIDTAKEGENGRLNAEVSYSKHLFRDRGAFHMRSAEYDKKEDPLHEVFMDFEWDGGKDLDTEELQSTLQDALACVKAANKVKESIEDDIAASKDMLFSVKGTQMQTEMWIRILTAHMSHLSLFVKRRNELNAYQKKSS